MIRPRIGFLYLAFLYLSIISSTGHTQMSVTNVCEQITLSSSGTDTLTFVRRIGGPPINFASSLIQTSDGSYVLGNWSVGLKKNDREFVLLKMDNKGNPLWAYRYDGAKAKTLFEVRETPDGGYAVLGRRIPNVILLKLDRDGKVQWAKKIKSKSPKERWGPSFTITNDGGFAIAATTAGFLGLGKNEDILLIKLDSDGKSQWSKVYGGEQVDRVTSIIETSDHGFLMGGMTDSHTPKIPDFLVIKTDERGIPEWSRIFGGHNTELLESLIEDRNGNYLIVGTTNSFGAGQDDVALTTLDAQGSIERAYVYGTSNADAGMSIAQGLDRNVLVVGFSENRNNVKGLVFQTDDMGALRWARKVDRPRNTTAGVSVIHTTDGGYAFLGLITSTGSMDIIFAKLDADGMASACLSEYTVSQSDVSFLIRRAEFKSKKAKVSVKKLKLKEVTMEIF